VAHDHGRASALTRLGRSSNAFWPRAKALPVNEYRSRCNLSGCLAISTRSPAPGGKGRRAQGQFLNGSNTFCGPLDLLASPIDEQQCRHNGLIVTIVNLARTRLISEGDKLGTARRMQIWHAVGDPLTLRNKILCLFSGRQSVRFRFEQATNTSTRSRVQA